MNHVKILVVEDEQGYRDYLKQHLEEQGHSVSVAVDGATALDAFTAEQVKAIRNEVR